MSTLLLSTTSVRSKMLSRLLLFGVVGVSCVQAQGLGGLWPVPQPTLETGSTPLFITDNVKVTYNGASVRWSTHKLSQTMDETYTKFMSQKQLDYKDPDTDALTTLDIVKYGVKRTLNSIFKENFVPWMLVPRRQLSSYEPSRNGSTQISSLAVTLSGSNATAKPSTSDIDESYNLTIAEDGTAALSAYSTTGVLHGLETFSQLFYTHSSRDAFYMVNAPIKIEDAP